MMKHRTEQGQSLVIFAFAILGLIAMMGLSLDLGLVYIERVRISRTADAAALGAVVELPFEEEAIRRAVELIDLNGYDLNQTQILVRGCINVGGNMHNVDHTGFNDAGTVRLRSTIPITGYHYPPGSPKIANPQATFLIDTLAYQTVDYDENDVITTKNSENCGGPFDSNASLFGNASKISVLGEVDVGMNFMQFFGFPSVAVSDVAAAENVTNLDVVVVFDVSGSMDFETTCFGCWREDPALADIQPGQVQANRFPSNGFHFPLDHPAAICASDPQPIVDLGGYSYSVHEAEFYSRDFPIHGWEFEKRQAGQGFWVLQRMGIGSNDAHIRTHPYPTYSQLTTANYPQLQGGTYNHECFDNAGGLTGECWKNRAASLPGNQQAPSNPPFVEYDFEVDWNDETHVWIRAIPGPDNLSFEWWGRGAGDLQRWDKSIYYQIDGQPVDGGPEPGLQGNVDWSQQDDDKWRWVKIAHGIPLGTGMHTLRLFQGSSGFAVDKIIITDNPIHSEGTVINDFIMGGREGPDATLGSATREACNLCNPIYGQPVTGADCSCKQSPGDSSVDVYLGGGTGEGCSRVLEETNLLENDLYHDVDPLRSAQEAVRNFAQRLDPKFDQIGFVTFSTNVQDRVKLQCRQWAGRWGGSDQVRKCYDPTTNPILYNEVLAGIENSVAQGSTNIAQGMKEGLEELGISSVDSVCPQDPTQDDGHSCDRRGGARRILILMTDGSPNTNGGAGCPATTQWRGQFAGGGVNDAYDCALHYAIQAADNNVVVYTIGIGSGVNRELLEAMATGTDPNPLPDDDGYYFEGKDGAYFAAAKPSDLDAIFESILSNIYVRIVG